jgi:hypothetical protein
VRWFNLDPQALAARVVHDVHLPLVRAGIGFVDGVQQEGKVNRTKAKAA